MIINAREILYSDDFYEDLKDLEAFEGRFLPKRGRKIVSDLIDFTTDTIASMPFAFQKYDGVTVKDFRRRAIFKKLYAIIYDVFEETIIFLRIYPTKKNPEGREI